ncbi:hypothetical protein [Methylovirgula sp. 4M-Z18]|uniref:hypothetical protein n=1 Tax=Methylovirgula sp. 4M-Z18 TaxID=2293567 RepID=UPI000E2E9442|nr:hypothetical protein [Methylovirgula sp. 4M-Z18]RFB77958.1 hypothetical protein DYH55_18225 [Methylovirgula sp. 4M-Z18]
MPLLESMAANCGRYWPLADAKSRKTDLQITDDLRSILFNTLHAGAAILEVLRDKQDLVVDLLRIANPTIAMARTNGTARTGGAWTGA